jgi:hypothetical protein
MALRRQFLRYRGRQGGETWVNSDRVVFVPSASMAPRCCFYMATEAVSTNAPRAS